MIKRLLEFFLGKSFSQKEEIDQMIPICPETNKPCTKSVEAIKWRDGNSDSFSVDWKKKCECCRFRKAMMKQIEAAKKIGERK